MLNQCRNIIRCTTSYLLSLVGGRFEEPITLTPYPHQATSSCDGIASWPCFPSLAFPTHQRRPHMLYLNGGSPPTASRNRFPAHPSLTMDSSSNNNLSTLTAVQTEQAHGNSPSCPSLLPFLCHPRLRVLTCPPEDQHETQLTAAAQETLPQPTIDEEPSVMMQRYLEQEKWEEPWSASGKGT